MPNASRGLICRAAIGLLCAFAMVSCESKEGSSVMPTSAPSGAAAGGNAASGKKPVNVAFVTNNPSDFWQIAKAGVNKAEKEFGVTCDFQMPPDGTAADQQRIVESLMAKGVLGMAISPNDPANQTELLNKIAAQMPLICHDSDAPKSNRIAYVGTNNFKAGQQAGELIKETLPNGGKIMLFVGRIDAQNARERADGIKDAIKGTKIELLDIRTDGTDRAKAKSNVEDTIIKTPDIACLVGLWSYNTPAIISAVKDAGKPGQIPIVGFDEEDDTLQGVLDGTVKATVVQQPFEFGYQSVRILTALARGEDAKIPPDKIIEVPVRVIKKDNVQTFWDELKKLRGK
jgi:ribose transport system substrate-binding protein